MASIKEKALFSLALILGVLVLGTIAFGWTNPAQNPPGGNVAAPLNAGGGTQVKTGGLNLGGNFSVTGTATFAGNVAIGTSTIGDKLTVVDSGGAVILLRSTNADTSSGLELQNDARKWALQVRGDDSDKLYIRDVTANAQRIIIDSSGKITIPGGQIGFPASQVASSDANTLDDYEEGTFTPGISFGGGTTGITYTVQAGSYIKIGRLVFVNGYIRMSNKGSSTGFARLTGLPFTQQSGDGYMSQSVIGQFNNFSSLNPNYFSLQREGGTNTFIFVNPASAGGSPLNEANFTNTSEFVFSMTYIATD